LLQLRIRVGCLERVGKSRERHAEFSDGRAYLAYPFKGPYVLPTLGEVSSQESYLALAFAPPVFIPIPPTALKTQPQVPRGEHAPQRLDTAQRRHVKDTAYDVKTQMRPTPFNLQPHPLRYYTCLSPPIGALISGDAYVHQLVSPKIGCPIPRTNS
jgi:hypothetical protein